VTGGYPSRWGVPPDDNTALWLWVLANVQREMPYGTHRQHVDQTAKFVERARRAVGMAEVEARQAYLEERREST
jgi:hypothetical protein